MPKCVVSEDEASRIKHGTQIEWDPNRAEPVCGIGDYIALLGADGALVAVGEVRLMDGRALIQPRVVL